MANEPSQIHYSPYAYAFNNSYNFIDPNGTEAFRVGVDVSWMFFVVGKTSAVYFAADADWNIAVGASVNADVGEGISVSVSGFVGFSLSKDSTVFDYKEHSYSTGPIGVVPWGKIGVSANFPAVDKIPDFSRTEIVGNLGLGMGTSMEIGGTGYAIQKEFNVYDTPNESIFEPAKEIVNKFNEFFNFESNENQ